VTHRLRWCDFWQNSGVFRRVKTGLFDGMIFSGVWRLFSGGSSVREDPARQGASSGSFWVIFLVIFVESEPCNFS
jgi:hypothetical protein